MKTMTLAACLLGLALAAGPVLASPNADCEARAAERKLSGAAKNSFVKKCIKDNGGDIAAMCEKSAADKKLHGAAKASHIKKCNADAAKG